MLFRSKGLFSEGIPCEQQNCPAASTTAQTPITTTTIDPVMIQQQLDQFFKDIENQAKQEVASMGIDLKKAVEIMYLLKTPEQMEIEDHLNFIKNKFLSSTTTTTTTTSTTASVAFTNSTGGEDVV